MFHLTREIDVDLQEVAIEYCSNLNDIEMNKVEVISHLSDIDSNQTKEGFVKECVTILDSNGDQIH